MIRNISLYDAMRSLKGLSFDVQMDTNDAKALGYELNKDVSNAQSSRSRGW
jgi:hypothetical protein